VLRIEEVERPSTRHGDVLVKIHNTTVASRSAIVSSATLGSGSGGVRLPPRGRPHREDAVRREIRGGGGGHGRSPDFTPSTTICFGAAPSTGGPMLGRSEPCHRFVTHSRNQEDTEVPRRTRRPSNLSTEGHWRNQRDRGGHDVRRVRDRASEGGSGPDSQADSHSVGHWQLLANVGGIGALDFDLRRTSAEGSACQKRGLQNRGEWGSRRLPCKRRSYSNADSKPWHLAALGGIQRIRTAISERAAAIC